MWRSSGQKCAVRFVKWPSRKGGGKIDSYPCCTTQISYVNQWKLNISQISIQNIIRFAMLQSWKHKEYLFIWQKLKKIFLGKNQSFNKKQHFFEKISAFWFIKWVKSFFIHKQRCVVMKKVLFCRKSKCNCQKVFSLK